MIEISKRSFTASVFTFAPVFSSSSTPSLKLEDSLNQDSCDGGGHSIFPSAGYVHLIITGPGKIKKVRGQGTGGNRKGAVLSGDHYWRRREGKGKGKRGDEMRDRDGFEYGVVIRPLI